MCGSSLLTNLNLRQGDVCKVFHPLDSPCLLKSLWVYDVYEYLFISSVLARSAQDRSPRTEPSLRIGTRARPTP